MTEKPSTVLHSWNIGTTQTVAPIPLPTLVIPDAPPPEQRAPTDDGTGARMIALLQAAAFNFPSTLPAAPKLIEAPRRPDDNNLVDGVYQRMDEIDRMSRVGWDT